MRRFLVRARTSQYIGPAAVSGEHTASQCDAGRMPASSIEGAGSAALFGDSGDIVDAGNAENGECSASAILKDSLGAAFLWPRCLPTDVVYCGTNRDTGEVTSESGV